MEQKHPRTDSQALFHRRGTMPGHWRWGQALAGLPLDVLVLYQVVWRPRLKLQSYRRALDLVSGLCAGEEWRRRP